MNVPQLYLPAVINALNLQKEINTMEQHPDYESGAYLKEPFLVLKDVDGIAERNTRLSAPPISKSAAQNRFYDDELGAHGAWGVIKLADKYDGPAIRVRKENP